MTEPLQRTYCRPASPDDPDALVIGYAPHDRELSAQIGRQVYWHWWLGQQMQQFIWDYFQKTAPSTEEERRKSMAIDNEGRPRPLIGCDCGTGEDHTVYHWEWNGNRGDAFLRPDGTWDFVGFYEALLAAM